MTSRKMTIITTAAVCIAVCAVLVLVLFLTGVFSTTSEESTMDSEQESPYVAVYDYLFENGTFNHYAGDQYDFGGVYYHTWNGDDGTYKLTRQCVWFENSQNSDIISHTFSGKGAVFADIGEPPSGDSLTTPEEYDEFLAWCDEIGFTPEELIGALDLYAEAN